jgi:hypothetical protein
MSSGPVFPATSCSSRAGSSRRTGIMQFLQR